jgi:hypothetical protein
VDLEVPRGAAGGLGDYSSTPGRRDGSQLWGFLRVAAQISEGASNEHKKISPTTRYESILHVMPDDCLLHWTSVVHQQPRPRVTALLLWSKPLGDECFESRVEA